ncbi:hypothetical protein ELI15_17160 [Rhizobium ruizarguesonis]|uniref:hypothetical protein n=1 Tax=Rhizobium ruizarguesonis TaxID=2081791 RepID=UPI00102F6E17|nr:hypothetical protein [Rhizobium ruizarguesonis]TAW65990.1 hypothetical protein ELI15_17160 [Rhizobium ruizarguesonis]
MNVHVEQAQGRRTLDFQVKKRNQVVDLIEQISSTHRRPTTRRDPTDPMFLSRYCALGYLKARIPLLPDKSRILHQPYSPDTRRIRSASCPRNARNAHEIEINGVVVDVGNTSALAPKKLVVIEGGHFDPYLSEFDKASGAAV